MEYTMDLRIRALQAIADREFFEFTAADPPRICPFGGGTQLS
jgi:hypothetical protein